MICIQIWLVYKIWKIIKERLVHYSCLPGFGWFHPNQPWIWQLLMNQLFHKHQKLFVLFKYAIQKLFFFNKKNHFSNFFYSKWFITFRPDFDRIDPILDQSKTKNRFLLHFFRWKQNQKNFFFKYPLAWARFSSSDLFVTKKSLKKTWSKNE